MAFGTGLAIYFIIWWLVLFTVLPFGVRTQDEADDVTLGTVPSAPAKFAFWTVVLRTTIVSAIVFGIYLFVTQYLGYSLDDLIAAAPDFR
jgi:Predicted secreted protein